MRNEGIQNRFRGMQKVYIFGATDGVTRIHIAEALAYRRIVPGRNALLVGA